MAGSPTAYLLLAGLYLLGIIVGLVVGSHIGELIGKQYERRIPGMLIGAAVGGTAGCLVMYVVARWGLALVLGLAAG